MYVSLSTLKENPAKYFELALVHEVIVTRHGERIGRIISEESAVRNEKQKAIESLIGSVPFPPLYDDDTYDKDYELLRLESYKDRGMI